MPSILWGLLVAILPILIHLFSLRNTKEVEFSTLRFIKELEHETIRKLKLRQWLLVLLRVLIIICLVLMFARPVQRGFAPGWMAGELESRVVIFVDNSASMAADTPNGNRLALARKMVPNIISIFEGQTNLSIYQTNPLQMIFSSEIDDPNEIRKAVDGIAPTQSFDRLWQSIDSVLTTLPGAEPNRECFIISDFQDAPSTVFLAQSGLDTAATGWRFYCLKVPETAYNLSLRNVEIVNQVRMPNHLLKINTTVKNDGSQDMENVPVELYLNEERVGQVVSGFETGRARDFLFQAYTGKSGIVTGLMTIPEDAFPFDNEYHFNLVIPTLINCTVVGASQAEIHLLLTALRSIDNDNHYLFAESRIDSLPQALFLDESDVLILYNPGSLPSSALEEIKTFLNNGGGVIWFSGDRILQAENSAAEQMLNLPHPRQLNQLEGEAFYSVSATYPDHPLLEDLELRDLDNELPQVFRYVDVSLNRSHRTILRLNNNRPLLLDLSIEGGRIFYFTSLLDLRWNDLAMRGLIVPLLHRMLMLLATDESNIQPLIVDQEKQIHLDRDLLKSEWELITPSGKRILLLPDFTKESLLITQTNELGQYRVMADGNLFTVFATRLSKYEHIDRQASERNIITRLPEGRARWINVSDDLASVLRDTRFGSSLWRTFLLIAIIMLIIETVIGRIKPGAVKKKASNAD
ncbi:MAG: BatA domain-containing protein [Candidatus Marinimicrobia bacterium]|nr:BatA domain-containing protein [Candidatus Neomarinimicrobiota bacterium]